MLGRNDMSKIHRDVDVECCFLNSLVLRPFGKPWETCRSLADAVQSLPGRGRVQGEVQKRRGFCSS